MNTIEVTYHSKPYVLEVEKALNSRTLKDVVYGLGSRFRHSNGDEYMICWAGDNGARALICLKNGISWSSIYRENFPHGDFEDWGFEYILKPTEQNLQIIDHDGKKYTLDPEQALKNGDMALKTYGIGEKFLVGKKEFLLVKTDGNENKVVAVDLKTGIIGWQPVNASNPSKITYEEMMGIFCGREFTQINP